jgi:hypothetical protein
MRLVTCTKVYVFDLLTVFCIHPTSHMHVYNVDKHMYCLKWNTIELNLTMLHRSESASKYHDVPVSVCNKYESNANIITVNNRSGLTAVLLSWASPLI